MDGYIKGHAQEMEMQVIAFVNLEASQAGAIRYYRLEFGCMVHPKLASVVLLFTRLF